MDVQTEVKAKVKPEIKASDFNSPMWRLPVVQAFTTFSKSTIYDGISRGTFPRPLKVKGRRIVVWPAGEVRAFMQTQAAK